MWKIGFLVLCSAISLDGSSSPAKMLQIGTGIQQFSYSPSVWGKNTNMVQLSLKTGLFSTYWYSELETNYGFEPDKNYLGIGGADIQEGSQYGYRDARRLGNSRQQQRYYWRTGIFFWQRYTLFAGLVDFQQKMRDSICCVYDNAQQQVINSPAGDIKKRVESDEGGLILGLGTNFRMNKSNLAVWATYGQWTAQWKNHVTSASGLLPERSVITNTDVDYTEWGLKWSYFPDPQNAYSLTVRQSANQYRARNLDFGFATPMIDFDIEQTVYQIDYTMVF